MANLLYRASTSATTPGSTSAKGSPLTNLEVDGNFKSVNDDLALKATIASPTFTGTPAAPTAAVNTNTTQLATTAFVVAQIADDAPTKSGSGATGTWGISISGNAATATSATTATTATSATSATTATTATNVAGGTAGGVVYQSGSGATGITLAGSAGQFLKSNGTSAPTWEAAGVAATDDTTTNATYYPSLFTATTGTQTAAKVSSTKLYFNPSTGTLNSTEFNSLSDLTQKTNTVKIENATETLKQIDGFEFDWLGTGKHSAGVIAQYLEKILPFLVQTNENGEKSVNYSGLIAYLIESNKELSKRIENLENQ